MEFYAQLFRELEEIDLRISRTRSGAGRGRGRRSTSTTRRAPTTYVRRGSGSSSIAPIEEEEDIVADIKESRYDEDGTILSDGDFGLVSLEDSSEDTTSSLHSESGASENEAHED